MKNFYKILLISISLITFNATADMYVGGGIYSANVNEGQLDDSDTVPAFFFGWKPIDFLAVEAGYYKLGDFSSNLVSMEANAYTVAAVGSIPLWVIDFYGKIGLAAVDYDINNLGDTKTDPFFGVGGAINLGDSIDIYAEFIRFETEVDIDIIGVGIRYQF